ncbi:MAG: hypothetical protein S0880_32935 [Actinomycetota bacterium]|nr:hypothetical protein [Actinomycetota bacterium]
MSGASDGPSDLFVDDPLVRETLEMEHRLRDNGYASLPHVLELGGEFPFEGSSVEQIVAEARRYLLHQQSVELSGARILASIGVVAVKAAAFDAIMKLHADRPSPPTPE